MGLEEASRWVAAAYQKNVGDLRSAKSIEQLTETGAELLNQLGRAGHVTLPNNGGADRTLHRELAMSRTPLRTVMANSATGNGASRISADVRLMMLAQRAADHVAKLESQAPLRLPARDIAKAWLIQQMQEEDWTATPEQLDKALTAAMEQRRS
jgi:hypothetical protein